jgi:DNA-binding response OmpR family regulator
MPPVSRNEIAEILAHMDGLRGLVRSLMKDIPAKVRDDLVAKGVDLHSLLTNILEKTIDRARGSSLQGDAHANGLAALCESISESEPSVQPRTRSNETGLRVGSLELDLLDRTAKRGDRQINLRPREFQLLKYMMERSDELLTRAAFLKDVWRYRFVPETNLVDVHMGRLRRKIDGPGDAPLIRNVRGVGFVLSATPWLESSPSRSVEPRHVG